MKLAERFWAMVDKNGPTPAHRPELGQCWLWVGHISRDGYGKFSGRLAHRIAWFLAKGAYSQVNNCHCCDNPACVRLSHLFEGSQKDNMVDASQKGRLCTPARRSATMRAQALGHRTQRGKSVCLMGHSYTESNTYYQNGRRSCKECRRTANRRWYAEHRKEV